MPVCAPFARHGRKDNSKQGHQGPSPRPEARKNGGSTGVLAHIANSVRLRMGFRQMLVKHSPNCAETIALPLVSLKRELSNGFAEDGIETSLTGFLKATMAGGLLFLLPVILIVIALRRATELAGKS